MADCNVTIRLPTEMVEQLRGEAERDGRSLSAYIRLMLLRRDSPPLSSPLPASPPPAHIYKHISPPSPSIPLTLSPPPAREARKPRTTPPADEAFEGFWTAYPRRVGKGAARTAWGKALAKGATVEGIMGGLRRASWPREAEYIPHPATWLNQERWSDSEGVLPAAATTPAEPVGNPLYDRLRGRVSLSDWGVWWAGCKLAGCEVQTGRKFVADHIRQQWGPILRETGLTVVYKASA